MVLMNYIALVPGEPAKMHFTDDYYMERHIYERETGKDKRVRSLVLWCDELNGEPAAKTFSILSEKLAAHITPFLPGKRYLNYDFIITQVGEGFTKDWDVQVLKRAEEQQIATPPALGEIGT